MRPCFRPHEDRQTFPFGVCCEANRDELNRTSRSQSSPVPRTRTTEVTWWRQVCSCEPAGQSSADPDPASGCKPFFRTVHEPQREPHPKEELSGPALDWSRRHVRDPEVHAEAGSNMLDADTSRRPMFWPSKSGALDRRDKPSQRWDCQTRTALSVVETLTMWTEIHMLDPEGSGGKEPVVGRNREEPVATRGSRCLPPSATC